MFLIPATTHQITWIKQNRLDTADYYPQAVIRDKKTDTILDTLDLENLGSDRYGVNWNVPQDPTGTGREISITITIYEDSGHTNISGIYGSWEETSLIYDLKPLGGGGGGSYGGVFDLNEIRKIVREEIAKIPEVKLKEVLDKIDEVKDKTDERIKQVSNLEQKTDSLSKLEKEIIKIINETDKRNSNFGKELNKIMSEFTKNVSKNISEIKNISNEEKQDIKAEINEGAKKIMNVFKEETLKAEDTLKQKIFKQMVITMDNQPNKKDDRTKKLLNYV